MTIKKFDTPDIFWKIDFHDCGIEIKSIQTNCSFYFDKWAIIQF